MRGHRDTPNETAYQFALPLTVNLIFLSYFVAEISAILRILPCSEDAHGWAT